MLGIFMRDLGLKIGRLPPTSAHGIVNYALVLRIFGSAARGKLLVDDIIFHVQLFIHGVASSHGAWVPRRVAPPPVKALLAVINVESSWSDVRLAALVLLAVQW